LELYFCSFSILCLPFVLFRQKGGVFFILGHIFVFVPE